MVSTTDIWQWMEEVFDPEIPVLTVVDLGVVREVALENNQPVITITPTYSGCPAMNMIEEEIKAKLIAEGFDNPQVKTVLHPAWTTDWMSEAGKKKLEEYGIAPPAGGSVDKKDLFGEHDAVRCPQCQSENTHMISQFGSTACKAMYQCDDCLEPFDYFKCL